MTPILRTSKPLLVLLFVIPLLLFSCGRQSSRTISLSGKTMGTTYAVTIADTTNDEQQIREQIDSLLQKINQLMSTYIPDSEVSLFNLSPDQEWFQFSPETFAVLKTAQQVAKESKGTFDITVGPLVDLWGFGPAPRPANIPSAAAIEDTKKHTGMHLLQLRPETFQAKKTKKGVHIDLSAIAKGYAVDAISEMLTSLGLENHLVEIGGEIIAKGVKADNSLWIIALEKPENQMRRISSKIVVLNNLALATSGTYRNYFEEDGVRYSHTIDPQTGRPITHNLVSVSVAADSCISADAWATALMVLGLEKGSVLAEQFHVAAFFTEKIQNDLHNRSTTQWNLFFP